MKRSIKILTLVLVIILGISLMSFVAFAVDIPTATDSFYVNDFAEIFTADEKARLIDNAVTLSNNFDGVQVVVTTIKTLDGNSIEDYAVKMYNQYGIGKNDMGALILLATSDRQIRIEVGRAMEAYITDSKAGKLIDNYAISYLKANNFSEGLISLQEALINEITVKVANDNTDSSVSNKNYSFVFSIILLLILGIVIVFFIVVAVKRIITKREQVNEQIASLKQKLENAENHISNLKDSYEETISKLSEDNSRLSSKCDGLESRLSTLQDRYNRVLVLYPTADRDVTAMIEEEIRQKDISFARNVDSAIQSVIHLPADKDNISAFEKALSKYSYLTDVQKSYVTSDINTLNQLVQDSKRLKFEYDREQQEKQDKASAATAEARISSIIACISVGRAHNLRQLQEAQSIYNRLSPSSRSYFDSSVLGCLSTLLKQAKQDEEEIRRKKEAEQRRRREEEERRRRREEEERRRRMQTSSHSSSYGGSPHHGGFGGHSGGGGASRGF